MSNLYATIRGDKMTGEIIEKGQGGQTRLDIKLTVGNRYRSHEIGIIRFIAEPNGDYILAIDRSSYGGNGGRVYEELITIRSEKKKGELTLKQDLKQIAENEKKLSKDKEWNNQ